ncbi:MAG: SDR family oxidoreductase, partial [Pseudomonadota bacterium]
ADAVIAAVEAIGPVDILVNNAGIFEPKDFFDTPYADWERFFRVNVMSGVWLAKALMPGMLDRGWGRVIFIASESAINIPAEMVHYGMTKTAQLAVSRGLAERTKGTAVTVNAVLPGPTMSDGVDTFLGDFASREGIDRQAFEREVFFREARPSSLIQRFSDPAEVANMIAYVASPRASSTNGAALRVDGGVVKSAF